MKKIAVITTSKELKEFQERTDIRILDINVKSCDQTWATQEYFVATIVYDDDLNSDPDYWTRLEHQAAIAAMQGMVKTYEQMMRADIECKMDCCEHVDAEVANEVLRSHAEACAEFCAEFAHALVEKLKEKEERK